MANLQESIPEKEEKLQIDSCKIYSSLSSILNGHLQHENPKIEGAADFGKGGQWYLIEILSLCRLNESIRFVAGNWDLVNFVGLQ